MQKSIGFTIFGTVWNIEGKIIEPSHGHVYFTNVLNRTIEVVS